MELETIKETVRASRLVNCENFIEVVEGDIVVPDIKPDILSIIRTDGNVYITKKEVQDSKIVLEGCVDVYAIYMSDDENNSLKGLNAILNFNESIDIVNCKIGMIPSIKCQLNDIDCKVLNSRKINVRCPVELSITIMENTEIDFSKGITNTENIETKKEQLCINEAVGVGTERVSLKENLSLSEKNLPIGEILKSSVCIVNKEHKISYNKVLAKADAKVKIIYVADDENSTIQSFETNIPFTGFVDLPGINDKTKVDIEYNVEYFYVKPTYQDLKANAISVEAEIEIVAKAFEDKEIEVLVDLYNPNVELNYNSEMIKLDQIGNKKNEKISLTQTLTIPELANARVLDVQLIPTITEKNILEDKAIIQGNAIVDILYYNTSKNILENKKIELPFQQTVQFNKVFKSGDLKIEVSIFELEYEFQRTGELLLKAILSIEAEIIDSLNLNIIKNIVQTDNIFPTNSSVIIYYVQPGDTLWSIAKKYRTTINMIKQANDLNDDNLQIGQQLLIPRRVCKINLNPLN